MDGSPWGGSEELWSQAALRLREDGHQVSASVVYWPELSSKVLELGRQGIELFVNEPRQDLTTRIWRKVKNQFSPHVREEFDWLQNQNPDLVVISQGCNIDGFEWMEYCANAGLPFVSIVQCNGETWWPDDERGIKLAKAYKAAKAVYCVSRANLKLLERQLGTPLPNASVVWNPYNVSSDEAVPWPEENGDWKLACVARLQPAAKGQDLLFEVMAAPHWQERAVEVNLFGGGPYENNLRNIAKNFGLKNVHFRGHVKEIKQIWAQNHLLVLPSRYEGLPLALVEAMWCGRPAVVTDIGGNAEVCVDDKTGFVAAAPTAGLLNQALERAWQRRNEWHMMGRAARARAEQLIPRDPIKDFCKRLDGCLKKQGANRLEPQMAV